ncbi:MAG: amidohydrolase family protein [Bacteroidota bacterium]
MNQPSLKNNKGCLRPLLIGIIAITSLSYAIFYTIFINGRYNGKDNDYEKLAIQNVDVWLGEEEVLEDVTVVVEGQLITCVGKDCQTPAGAKVIDGSGKSVLPALVDMQLSYYALTAENKDKSAIGTLIDYVRQRPDVRKNLHEAGVTTIRSAADPMANIATLKRQVVEWEMAGPRVYGVGPVFTAIGGHPASTLFKDDENLQEIYVNQVSDSNVARNLVLEVLENSMDGIKLVMDDMGGTVPKLSDGLARAIISQAKRKNVWVSVRAGSNEDINKAISWGANMVEGGSVEQLDSTTISLMKANNTLYLPLLFASSNVPEGMNSAWFEKPYGNENMKAVEAVGIKIGLGSNPSASTSFGSSLHREMEMMVEAGLSPHKVIRAATQDPLQLLKMDDQLGRIAEDYLAEFILINGKPWENIADIRKVDMVWQEGKWIVEHGQVRD